MGFLDDLLGTEKKAYKEKPEPLPPAGLRESSGPLALSIRFLPLRLSAKKENQTDMLVTITNRSASKQLVSFDASVPVQGMLGFDRLAANKRYEKKLGYVEPGAKIEFATPVYGTSQTREGNYVMAVAAYAHFVDYNKVSDFVKRTVSLRVV